ncbi:MAG: aspartate aminotransferase, partial [Candidatus Zixiibacteriota bacterium]
YLFLNFEPFREKLKARGITDSKTLCERLLQDTGAALLPGEVFGRNCEELTARLAYVDFDGAAALAASNDIPLAEELPAEFADRYCGRVIEAAKRIAMWVAE